MSYIKICVKYIILCVGTLPGLSSWRNRHSKILKIKKGHPEGWPEVRTGEVYSAPLALPKLGTDELAAAAAPEVSNVPGL